MEEPSSLGFRQIRLYGGHQGLGKLLGELVRHIASFVALDELGCELKHREDDCGRLDLATQFFDGWGDLVHHHDHLKFVHQHHESGSDFLIYFWHRSPNLRRGAVATTPHNLLTTHQLGMTHQTTPRRFSVSDVAPMCL